MRVVPLSVSCALFVSLLAPTSASAQWRAHFSDARRDPLRISVSLTSAVATYTASHNEYMNGAFRSASAQFAKPVFRMKGTTIAWFGEVLPVMLVTSEAPAARVPVPGDDPSANDATYLARYARHDAYGFGLAPLGAEASHQVSGRTRLVLNVTSGGAWFTRVVPYGRATQANFTVAPGLLVERSLGRGGALSAGYVLHHLSNASMGGANPGMNSHLVSVRWTRATGGH
jgi:hypothetical protein